MAAKKAGFREKNGRIEYRFQHRKKRISVYGATQKECREKARKRIEELEAGIKTDSKSITWKEYCEEWLLSKEATAKPSTILSYSKKLKMLSMLDKMKLVDIERRDILMLQAQMAKKYSSSTVNWMISKTREIFESAIADNIITRNPVVRIQPLSRREKKVTETIHRALSKNEQDIFFEHARSVNAWYLEVFELMIVTGMRVGEVGGLVWGDIGDRIDVHCTVAQVGPSEYARQSPKTAAGCRKLPLTPAAKEILARQRVKLAEYKGISFTAPDQPVFVTFMSDHLINPSIIDSAILQICKRANIERFTSHAFRDTYATRCIMQGMQPNTLKVLMGHTKIAITMDLYAQVKPEDMELAMQNISIL